MKHTNELLAVDCVNSEHMHDIIIARHRPKMGFPELVASVVSDEDDGLPGITNKEAEANARRIVALWNACIGISTEALEGGVVAEMVGACELLDLIDRNGVTHLMDLVPAAEAARAVLAKVKPQ